MQVNLLLIGFLCRVILGKTCTWSTDLLLLLLLRKDSLFFCWRPIYLWFWVYLWQFSDIGLLFLLILLVYLLLWLWLNYLALWLILTFYGLKRLTLLVLTEAMSTTLLIIELLGSTSLLELVLVIQTFVWNSDLNCSNCIVIIWSGRITVRIAALRISILCLVFGKLNIFYFRVIVLWVIATLALNIE